MAILRTLRTHWKKSVFFFGLGCYGVHRGWDRYEETQLMKRYCLEASRYGDVPLSAGSLPYRVTVILNPAASSGKAKAKYEDYCAPLLHLAGIKVSVIRTEGIGQAKEIMDVMSTMDADAVLIAGGDGTLMETVTGLLRRSDSERVRKTLPLGILPVGRENYFAKTLFPSSAENETMLMAEATMAVLRRLFRPVDVLEISNLENENEENKKKKLYGLRDIQIGAFRDAHQRMDKYWFFGNLKKLMTYVFAFTTASKEICWNVSGQIHYSSSSSNVEEVAKDDVQNSTSSKSNGSSWFSSWFYKSQQQIESVAHKPLLRDWISLPKYNGSELTISSENCVPLRTKESGHDLNVRFGPTSWNFSDFVKHGWSRESRSYNRADDDDRYNAFTKYSAKSVRFFPEMKDAYFSLDNENVELAGPLEINLLPNKVHIFCPAETHYNFVVENEEPKNGKKWWQKTGTSNSALLASRRV